MDQDREKTDAKLHEQQDQQDQQELKPQTQPESEVQTRLEASPQTQPQTQPQTETEETKKAEGRTAEQEAGKMRNIQAIVTTVAIILVAFLVIKNWNADEGYMLRIPTDEGCSWSYSIEGESQSLLKVTSEAMEDGKYICKIDGLAEGEAEIHVRRFAEEAPDDTLEERIYHVMITEDGTIVQKKVDRTVYED